MSHSAILRLTEALDIRADTGAPVLPFWWRDDDLETPSSALSDLLVATRDIGVIPAIAAISGTVSADAIAALDGWSARVLPHGWHHKNHEPPGAKKSEYGPARSIDMRIAEIDAACDRILALAGERALAVFTPPWNNMGSDLPAHLDRSKAMAVSAYRTPVRPPLPATRPRLDTHLDLIDWRGTGQGLSADQLVDLMIPWIKQMPDTENPLDSPVGVLSHHVVTKSEDWRSWAPIWWVIASHAACEWVCPETALCMVRGDKIL